MVTEGLRPHGDHARAVSRMYWDPEPGTRAAMLYETAAAGGATFQLNAPRCSVRTLRGHRTSTNSPCLLLLFAGIPSNPNRQSTSVSPVVRKGFPANYGKGFISTIL